MDINRGKITFAALAAAVICGVIVGFIARGETNGQTAVIEPVSDVKISPAQINKPRYLLSHHKGKLAVYIIGKDEPELVFDRFLHYLPDVDRLKLEKGIEVSEYSELLRLIEDYTS